jgi:hypothetical protein
MHVPEMVGGAVAAAAQQGRVINPMLQTPACAGCQTIEMARASERRRGSDVIDGFGHQLDRRSLQGGRQYHTDHLIAINKVAARARGIWASSLLKQATTPTQKKDRHDLI